MQRSEIDELWFQQRTVPGAAYRLNDSVVIVAGEHAGTLAFVIALVALEPEPKYLVELANTGRDMKLPESALRAA